MEHETHGDGHDRTTTIDEMNHLSDETEKTVEQSANVQSATAAEMEHLQTALAESQAVCADLRSKNEALEKKVQELQQKVQDVHIVSKAIVGTSRQS